MPRRSRLRTKQYVFHVFNRAIQGVTLFETNADYDAFLRVLSETCGRIQMRVLAYVVMPNHWHLVLWPLTDEGLSDFMRWLTATHASRWRTARGNKGRGAVYQGRFKAIAVQEGGHFLRLCRYVERNPVRARLVGRAEHWPWSSASVAVGSSGQLVLSEWPVRRPEDWIERLNVPEPARSLEKIRAAVWNGRHYGSPSWRLRTSRELRWRSGLQQSGRPQAAVDTLPSQSGPTDS